jgi:methylisocitrate lyase
MNTPDRRAEFRRLHESGCFVMPNPWDAGSARALAGMGFKAVATTSAGFAWSMARPDNGVTLEQALAHLRAISAEAGVPVNADFEGGFAAAPEAVAANVTAAAATGVSGLSIEDSTGDPAAPLYDFTRAVERIRAAREALDASGTGVLLTGRCEAWLLANPDRDAAFKRLIAYAEAGAECLFAPGMRSPGDIADLVRAVAPKPVNVVVSGGWTSVADLARLGVRRISIGGSLARAAWTGFLAAAREIAAEGTFQGLEGIVASTELNAMFRPK